MIVLMTSSDSVRLNKTVPDEGQDTLEKPKQEMAHLVV